MNPRITNEIRILLPGFAVGIVMLLCSLWGTGEIYSNWLIAAYCLSCPLVAVTSFGTTFNNGMLNHLLAQPISRVTVWREKRVTLAVSLLALFGLYSLLAFAESDHLGYQTSSTSIWAVGIAVPLFAFGWGVLLTLFVREAKAALFLTFFMAIFIAFLFETAVNHLRAIGGRGSDAIVFISTFNYPVTELAVTAIACSLAAIILARRRFLRFQDYSILSREYTIGSTGHTSVRCAKDRRHGRFANAFALIRKEINLQQTSFIFIIGVVLAGFLLRPEDEPRGPATMVMLWTALLAPVLFGLMAIAEERRMGINEWEFTLPTQRARQWGFKLLTVWLLAWLIGEFMIRGIALLGNGRFSERVFPIPNHFLYSFAAGLVGLFASSMARNFFQALGMLVSTFLLIYFLQKGSEALFIERYYYSYHSPLHLFNIVLPTLLALLTWLTTRSNYFRPTISAPQVAKSFGILVAGAVLSYAITMSVFYRTWELIKIPVKNSPAILVRSEKTIVLISNLLGGTAITPAGNLWSADWSGASENGVIVRMPNISRIGRDTNWVSVFGAWNAFYALKGDGTIWQQRSPTLDKLATKHLERWMQLPTELTQLGSSTNWVLLAGDFSRMLGIQSDGSLWQWGRILSDIKKGSLEYRFVRRPERIGTDTNWVHASASYYAVNHAVKRDGSVWRWGKESRLSRADATCGIRAYSVVVHEPKRVREFEGADVVEVGKLGWRAVAKLRSGETVTTSRDQGYSSVWEIIELPFKGRTDLVQIRPDLEIESQDSHRELFLTIDGKIMWFGTGVGSKPVFKTYVTGTNWISLGSGDQHLAMKDDGSLWAIGHSSYHINRLERNGLYPHTKYLMPPRFRPYRIGFLFGENDLTAPKPKGH